MKYKWMIIGVLAASILEVKAASEETEGLKKRPKTAVIRQNEALANLLASTAGKKISDAERSELKQYFRELTPGSIPVNLIPGGKGYRVGTMCDGNWEELKYDLGGNEFPKE